jgi:hypothetical protein
VTVSSLANGGTVSGATTVCTGTNSTALSVSGNTGTIQWQLSTDNSTFTNITNATTANYTASNLTQTTYYRVFVTNGACTANSSSVTVTVSPLAVGGNVSGSTTVCSGTNSTLLTLNGYTGSIAKWQWSASPTFASGINDITNTAATFTASDLTSTRYYRVLITNGACSTYSSIATVTVDALPVSGSVTGATTVCTGSNTSTVSVSGSSGVIQWQSSADDVLFSDISSQSGASYTATNLTQTTYYRVKVSNGVCSPVFSNSVKITVSELAVAGFVSGDTTVCASSNNFTVRITGNNGTVQWQVSSNNNTFTNLTSANSASYSSSSLTNTRYYRALVINGACSTYSNVATVVVDPVSVGGSIEGEGSVCTGTNSTLMRLGGYTGRIQWQYSVNNSDFFDLLAADTIRDYTAVDLTQTTYYRAKVTSGVCTAVYSDTATMMVNPLSVAGTVAITSNDTVCSGTAASVSVTGNVGTIQWQQSANGVVFSNVSAGGTSSSYTSGALTNSTYYRVIVTSGVCTPDTSNVVFITVGDFTPPVTPVIAAATGECSVTLTAPITTDNCAGTITGTTSSPLTYTTQGTYTITWKFDDGNGNTTTANQTVVVDDVTSPVISSQGNKIANTGDDGGNNCSTTVNLGQPIASDNCHDSIVKAYINGTEINPSTHLFGIGETIVTWKITDIGGNEASVTQKVTVIDNEKPTITAPANVTVYADAGQCTASGVVLGSATTGDNCSVASTTNNAPATYNLGNNTVTWTVTDGSGNTAKATQTVTVVDTAKPTITAPANVTVYTDAGQ